MSLRRHPRILIVKLSAIGDVVHALPALNTLRAAFPNAHIAWLIEEAAAPLINRHPALDRVLLFKRKQWIKGLTSGHFRRNIVEMVDFWKQLRDTHYDLILDLQGSLKGALPILAARGRRKTGFGAGLQHQEFSYLALNERIAAVSMEIHALERNLLMLDAIGVPRIPVTYGLPITDQNQQAARDLLRGSGWRDKDGAVAVNPVAKWETKLWPEDRFAALADALIETHAVRIFFTGAPEDAQVIARIQSLMAHASVNLAGRTSLLELAAVYQQVACVVSTDTGPMHIAAAAGAPVVALFGPTAPWRTGPYGPGHRVLVSKEKCFPCFKRHCRTQACMRAIGVGEVFEQVDAVLREKKGKPAA